MKKVLFLAILILNSQFLILNSLRAQGFEWVMTYTGEEVTSGVTTNQRSDDEPAVGFLRRLGRESLHPW